MTSFYSEHELQELGLHSVGKGVLISRKSSFYSPESIRIGNNVRIDDFCILSGDITIGSHIHISAYCALYGAFGITLHDFTGMSPRSTIYSAMDNFSGDFLIGPIHPIEKTDVTGGRVIMKQFSHLGACSTIFPNIVIEEGAVIGAYSLVNTNIPAWKIYCGIPAKYLKDRSTNLLNLG
ncbi:MAG: acyltransferase [Bacteroidales bacterium]|jgi:galactoside O-acetyltransferase|nr:acyltransferase [Bacteroidales bacterium]HOY39412.1 acyltransferase [Bacteroidales bacterium]HQP04376.1 acyltransferase [Bacteroidales bacterium]